MSNQTCDCCEITTKQSTENTLLSEQWLDKPQVTNMPLPSDLASTMSRFLGESVETLEDFISAVRDGIKGDSLTVNDLCLVEDKTAHQATIKDETYHFQCFYDGIALAHLLDESVEIRTKNTINEVIEIQVSPNGDTDVTPPRAVMSFGVATDTEAPIDDGPTSEEIYEAICPYVKAFSTRESYEHWAENVSATTVGMPLTAGVPFAAVFVD